MAANLPTKAPVLHGGLKLHVAKQHVDSFTANSSKASITNQAYEGVTAIHALSSTDKSAYKNKQLDLHNANVWSKAAQQNRAKTAPKVGIPANREELGYDQKPTIAPRKP